ncbi:lipase [Antrihabitans sp. YC3-6]|uniref:Lipase n=1 Tax=Antrihabitans stalagmiti TaxID=2799499 RepID=A0A934U3N1_9NOCA|nr:lipase family protein [Antrihabitans stalagmiti]MBJ8339048.1 lipase [Antrihabitans stalagmiti]
MIGQAVRIDGEFRPGDLLDAERMKAYIVPGVPMPARAWRIRYRSTSATGHPTMVSGVVLVPTTRYRGKGARPLIGYAIGTQGLSNASAPSRQLAAGTEYEAVLIAGALRRGWAITLTDYPGLATPGDHPYVMGRALGPAVLDCVRAARQLGAAGLDPEGPLAIYGYSEGGHAAGWALELQPTYAPDLPLVGGVVGAAPADLEQMIPTHDGGTFAFLLIYGLIGLNAAYPELDVYSHLTPKGHRAVERFGNTNIFSAIALGASMFPKKVSAYVQQSPYELPEVIARLRENALGSVAPAAPVLIGASTHDQIIPHAQARKLERDWRAAGADVRRYDMRAREHVTGGIFLAPKGFGFLAERFAAHDQR